MFGADSKEISIVEFNHNNDKMVRTLQYESGLIVLMNRLGEVLPAQCSTHGLPSWHLTPCAQAAWPAGLPSSLWPSWRPADSATLGRGYRSSALPRTIWSYEGDDSKAKYR